MQLTVQASMKISREIPRKSSVSEMFYSVYWINSEADMKAKLEKNWFAFYFIQ